MAKEKYLLLEEHFDYVVNKIMSKRWRDYKSTLKENYFNISDPYANVLPQVIDSQWHALVQYWLSEAGHRISDINKENRKKQALNHMTGIKSFAQVRQEMTSSGIPPSRVQLFI